MAKPRSVGAENYNSMSVINIIRWCQVYHIAYHHGTIILQ